MIKHIAGNFFHLADLELINKNKTEIKNEILEVIEKYLRVDYWYLVKKIDNVTIIHTLASHYFQGNHLGFWRF